MTGRTGDLLEGIREKACSEEPEEAEDSNDSNEKGQSQGKSGTPDDDQKTESEGENGTARRKLQPVNKNIEVLKKILADLSKKVVCLAFL